jgi:hypothetical protein
MVPRLLLRAERGLRSASWASVAEPGQRRVLLHVGLHKTGTTALQLFLSKFARHLQAQGVVYPKSGRPQASLEAHHNVAWQLAGDRRYRSSAGTLDEVASEISSFPGDAILSSEDFETILGTPVRFLPLLNHPLLKEHAFTIAFWVRDQASYLESLFFQMLNHRMAEEAARFCESALAHGEIRYEDWTFHTDYQSIYARLLELPAHIAVRPYPWLEGDSTVVDFLTFAGLVFDEELVRSQDRSNSRQSLPEALSLFWQHRLGKALVDRVLPRELLAQLLDGRAAHLSSPGRAALIARFAAGNQRLSRACGFPAEALAIAPFPPRGCIPLEALFSFRMQNALVDLAGENVNTTDPRSVVAAAVGEQLHTA